jgi:Ala-tRNA(Pro) deacylase
MPDKEKIYSNILGLLTNAGVEYKLFEHRQVLSYQEIQEVQKECGWVGTEAKCLVLKTGEAFVVYVTVQGQKVNFDSIKQLLGVDKARLATPDELMENFGAEPGCAYPFGFDQNFNIFVDPKIYEQEWLLFSPLYPTKTVQAKGADLKNLFQSLKNKVVETTEFNLNS